MADPTHALLLLKLNLYLALLQQGKAVTDHELRIMETLYTDPDVVAHLQQARARILGDPRGG